MVDTMGMLLAVVVHPADVQDRDGAKLTGRFPRLQLIWADGGYAVMSRRLGGADREASQGQPSPPRRWVVERTWLGWEGAGARTMKPCLPPPRPGSSHDSAHAPPLGTPMTNLWKHPLSHIEFADQPSVIECRP